MKNNESSFVDDGSLGSAKKKTSPNKSNDNNSDKIQTKLPDIHIHVENNNNTPREGCNPIDDNNENSFLSPNRPSDAKYLSPRYKINLARGSNFLFSHNPF